MRQSSPEQVRSHAVSEEALGDRDFDLPGELNERLVEALKNAGAVGSAVILTTRGLMIRTELP